MFSAHLMKRFPLMSKVNKTLYPLLCQIFRTCSDPPFREFAQPWPTIIPHLKNTYVYGWKPLCWQLSSTPGSLFTLQPARLDLHRAWRCSVLLVLYCSTQRGNLARCWLLGALRAGRLEAREGGDRLRAVISREHGPVAVQVYGESFSVRARLHNFPTPVASASALLAVAPPTTPLLLTLVLPVHTIAPRPSIPPVPVLRYPNSDRVRPGGERVRGRDRGRGDRIREGSRDCWFFSSSLPSFLSA